MKFDPKVITKLWECDVHESAPDVSEGCNKHQNISQFDSFSTGKYLNE